MKLYIVASQMLLLHSPKKKIVANVDILSSISMILQFFLFFSKLFMISPSFFQIPDFVIIPERETCEYIIHLRRSLIMFKAQYTCKGTDSHDAIESWTRYPSSFFWNSKNAKYHAQDGSTTPVYNDLSCLCVSNLMVSSCMDPLVIALWLSSIF